ncbi:hypothetical protein JOF56_006413 [Kibdelosporangium banguiense]|uniref:CBM6 domain-containing protein n=1 Tax=Kibdelosporangium banguiense TaxID=1365924 RepID=A0ABS4TNP1_9PSEU|nr:CBM35 domain-containing protein [Kibdelosporangium banguiense]MBP2326028.1 hypothetical protein [Kibdelosporangium banguiense]
MLALTLFSPLPAAAQAEQLIVDLGKTAGPVLHGGNGSLYGLSDDGVPSDNLLAPLKITSIAQKAPDGLQHPNGDALAVADSFRRNGGGDIQVYMQDIYKEWPYEDLGIADYLSKVDVMVRKIAASPHRKAMIYVPFNEPDAIWYGLGVGDQATYERNRDRFFADWKTVYQRIRALDPGARIAGPNETAYHGRLMADFLAWTKANNVLPDVITWHELSSSSLRTYRASYRAYRDLERANGISPRVISINEYANRRDLSVPGQMVQWVSMFEDTKVYADQPYWDIAGNLDGNTVGTNSPNGSWWFFRWYAGMSGQTVSVTPPKPETIDTLQGLASVDRNRRQAHVLVGGTNGSADVVLRGADRSVFGSKVVVTVEEAAWTGYEGTSAPPKVLRRAVQPIGANGSLTVPLTGMKQMSAYRIVLTPAGIGAPQAASVPWSADYEAENAAITSGTVYTQGTVSNPNGYAASGTKDVGSLNRPDSKVDFTVSVPSAGTYSLRILYGNQTDAPARQVVKVDGVQVGLAEYPRTLNWTYRAAVDMPVKLTAGTHTLSLAKDRGEVTLDKIELSAVPAPGTDYPATLAETSGNALYCYFSGLGEVLLPSGSKSIFDVYAPTAGYYEIKSDHSGLATLEIGKTRIGTLKSSTRVFLIAGINRVSVVSNALTVMRGLRVTPAADQTGVTALEAENATLAGVARVADNIYASGGKAVGYIGTGAANTLTFNGVQAPRAGNYVLIVHYANDERAGSGNYNTNVVSRTADISVNGGPAQRATFRNTYSWNQFWSLAIPVTLKAGSNSLSFANATTYAPDIDRIELAPLS